MNDDHGFNIDKTDLTEENLKVHGGSITELDSFVAKAIKCALIVGHRSEAIGKIVGSKKRKGEDNEPTKLKLSKVDKVEADMKTELNDPEGLEMSFPKKFIGRVEVPISKLRIFPQVSLPLSPFKVAALATGMLQKFDPTQMSVMVTPAKDQEFDATKLEDNAYEVFYGRHRLAALQQLEKRGLLHKLEQKDDHCAHCECDMLHGFELWSSQGEPNTVRLGKETLPSRTRIHYGRNKRAGREKSQKTMSRYAKLLSYGADDIGALRKLGSWSLDGIAELSKCLKAFQNLKTLDGSSKEFVQRKFAQLKKKEVIAFPNVLFRKLMKYTS